MSVSPQLPAPDPGTSGAVPLIAAAGPLPFGARHRRLAWAAFVAISLASFVGMAAQFFAFQAEDAYIVSRYAHNLVAHGQLVYNLGERICALTSPLHAFVVALFYRAFAETALSNRLFGLFCLAVALLLILRPFRRDPLAAGAVVALAALSPFAILWVGAGLETGLLVLIVTAFVAVLYRRRGAAELSAGSGLALSALAGLTFLARFDAILFLLPAGLYCALRMPRRRALACALPGAALAAAWLAFARSYFGDMLPTSFYVKTPRLEPEWAAGNAVYLADLYLVSGFLVVHLFVLTALALEPRGFETARRHLRELWWAYAGLALVGLYGLAAAHTHMMFSFRLFVPFLPAAALVTADLLSRLEPQVTGRRRVGQALRAALAVVVVLQGVSFLAVRLESIGGGRTGELRAMSAAEAQGLVDMMGPPSERIRSHWREQPASLRRRARVHTHAAGILPYRLPEADAYDVLTAYRHRCKPDRDELRREVDYVVVLSPNRVASTEERLVTLFEHYELVFEQVMISEGVARRWRILFNPDPQPFLLPPRIDDPCLAPGRP